MRVLNLYELTKPKVSNFQVVCTWINQKNVPEKYNNNRFHKRADLEYNNRFHMKQIWLPWFKISVNDNIRLIVKICHSSVSNQFNIKKKSLSQAMYKFSQNISKC